ncbi:hypothetical protein FH609_019605 [Streptomyces sp. 3MP-14]|uniref:Uncharacterized protein n=1 Tax=Streptomyces mimosae TaxID=2586635 RepID=A0A5N6A6I6_9ACTN|nr:MULTISPECIES: hypothetical protein [Streptomyces]KAB8163852.1 hypothetical protein FH607_018145 [Streptomyces mimosae]KAB8175295.1 hypothetical protein FH609_019605 [Streptomyces sp. 3MP-14]
MNTAPPVVFPAQRPLTRWGVLRRARITVENGQLVVRTHSGAHAWPVGPGGVASAIHLPGRLCPAASRTGWGDASKGTIDKFGGCLHLLDGAGQAVACLAPSDWVTTGGRPATLDRPDARPTTNLDPGAGADYLERSGLGDLLRQAGVPVHTAPDGQEPPRAPKFAGPLRPGPRAAASTWLVPSFALLILVFFSWAPTNAEARNIVASVPFLVTALVCFGTAALSGLAGQRAGRTTAAAELKPSPGVPVTRAFLDRSALRLTAEAVELRTAQNELRLIPPPADPVNGVREAVVFEDAGRPWGVALADARGTVHAFLHWDTWFAGDPQFVGLSDFCQRAGLGLRRQRLAPFPAGEGEDRAARPWRTGDYGMDQRSAYGSFVPGVLAGGLFLVLFFGLFVWDVEWTPFFPVLGAAFAIGVLPYVVRGAYRKWTLNRLVQPQAVGGFERSGGSRFDKQGGATP